MDSSNPPQHDHLSCHWKQRLSYFFSFNLNLRDKYAILCVLEFPSIHREEASRSSLDSVPFLCLPLLPSFLLFCGQITSSNTQCSLLHSGGARGTIRDAGDQVDCVQGKHLLYCTLSSAPKICCVNTSHKSSSWDLLLRRND